MLMIVTMVAGRMGMMEKNGSWAAEAAAGKAQKKNQPVVVIDSGHGGNDPGKIGVSGQEEKAINSKNCHEAEKIFGSGRRKGSYDQGKRQRALQGFGQP